MDPNSPLGEPQTRHDTFYFDNDSMAIFLVENKLFKVHRHPFIQGSAVFRDMFAQAGGKTEGAIEGKTEEKPIPLPGVTVKEFEVLLRYFYATMMGFAPNENNLIQVYDQEERLALLSITRQFVFDKIFRYITKEINPEHIPIVDRIRFGNKCNLNGWLLSAYKEILERTPEGKPTKEEAELLGLEGVNKLLQAKNFILHERLEKALFHKSLIESLDTHVSSCRQCMGCPRRPNLKFNVGVSGTTPTEKVLKKYLLDDSEEQDNRAAMALLAKPWYLPES